MKHFRFQLLILLAAVGFLVLNQLGKANGQVAVPREKAVTLQAQGNYKEAYDGFSLLALDPKDDPLKVGSDLTNAIACLQNLGRIEEFDDFIEKVIAAHPDNWRLLSAAAISYNSINHNGFQIVGKYSRGYHRGGGKAVNSNERDRVRAMQLMVQAIGLTAAETDKNALADLHWNMANMLMGNRGYNEAWRLQDLTDLTVLPDYDEGYWNWYGNTQRGAPVQEDGTPVYYSVPKSWADAQNDGERWRWEMQQTMELAPARSAEVNYTFAQFLENQFGVNTMAQYRWYFSQQDRSDKVDTSGPYELSSLKENETIAQLATGIKRFTLPDEFNYIKIYQQIAAQNGNGGYGHNALETLGRLFSDRRQYDRSAEYYKLAGDTEQVNQILGNWGVFEPVTTQPAGKGATVEYRFRNASEVNMDATEIDTAKLLNDVKAYLKANPKQLDWQNMDVENLGYRLVNENQAQYLKGEKIAWTEKLTPRPNHFDKRVTITTPATKAGAYLVKATMPGGNISRIIIWVADTAIAKKPMPKGTYYYVADAVTGAPVPNAKLDFFGYHQDWVNDKNGNGGTYNIKTTSVQATTDAEGQFIGDPLDTNYTWLTTATTDKRLAYLGFSGAWYGGGYDSEYNAMKTFALTDRPVYRPNQAMKFKFWVSTAKYDQGDKNVYAGKSFPVVIYNPKGEKIFEKTYTADEFGGIDGDYTLAKDATLGVYSVQIPYNYYNQPVAVTPKLMRGAPLKGIAQAPVIADVGSYTGGSVTFRVEEYKKPEFEVKVDAPTAPVMLGDKIQATIKANYYFGAPVTDAKVKYKILRTGYTASWYPAAKWDWFYGPGYWWYGYDYTWYPGWSDWGCARPTPIWWQGYYRNTPQPELIAEIETVIGADGTVKVDIDTALAKAIQGDMDHKYEITAEVTDKSRRTITGAGTVLVARKPFKVYVSVDRGYYRVGDVIRTDINAQTLSNQPVPGKGNLRLLKISYNKDGDKVTPIETEVQQWALETNDLGVTTLQIKATEAGQYRLSYTLDDNKGHNPQEGGYVFTIRGDGADTNQYRFNDIELVQDKREYKPGEAVSLKINTNQPDSTVLLFVRPANGVYLAPKVLHLIGQSTIEEIAVTQADMPNFFIEAVTVCNGKLYSETREIAVPPVKRAIDVAVTPTSATYKPGEIATVKIKLTDPDGNPVVGSTAVTMYDKSLEYISGGSNVPDIKDFFWKWRRSHYQSSVTNLTRGGYNITLPDEITMGILGAFGYTVADDESDTGGGFGGGGMNGISNRGAGTKLAMRGMAMDEVMGAAPAMMERKGDKADSAPMGSPGPLPGMPDILNGVMPIIRSDFADSAFWAPSVITDANGEATIDIQMPENLTTWKTKVWAMGNGTAVGEGSAELVTSKKVIIRLQAPRFFVQKDEVVLSAVVHNYLSTKKTVKVVLEADGGCLQPLGAFVNADPKVFTPQTQIIEIEPNTDQRVDWRVAVTQPGEATIRMKAITDEESDAMEQKFPVYVHGMLKTESFSGVIRPDATIGAMDINVPAERRPEQSKLEIRYSPTLAGAMVDALPYMVDYPYGCTEQTLNRFLPTVITQKVLLGMGLNLKDIEAKRTNLNAQEIGNDVDRAKQWQRFDRNPVFNEEEVNSMVKAGIEHLASMQCADGGWGWFSGYGEYSYAHTTAVVVHGLQQARANGVAVPPDMIARGIQWLTNDQNRRIAELQAHKDWTAYAMDAYTYMVLVDEKVDNIAMRDFLYRDRLGLPVYSLCMFGIALDRVKDTEKRDMVIRNIDQYLVQDDENQTAYLRLPQDNYWWYWYGSEYEAQAYYLKLLTITDAKGQKASRMVKYLLNNRKNATYWNSTRDTAIVVEAFADYMKASGEDKPNMTVDVMIDGVKVKTVKIDNTNLFTFDNKVVLEGAAVTTGAHKIELVKTGVGPLYYNAYLTNFTLEDMITRAGLEIKVNRKYYKLERVAKSIKVEGSHGQAVDQAVVKYNRIELANLDTVKSGDMVEIELEIDSKNDYEYILFEDMKAAGFEPAEVQSGYNGNEMGAYMELHDERVSFFVRSLARGKHSISYRMRAEIPGQFSALPTKASAMYAPELKANSDEIKLKIVD